MTFVFIQNGKRYQLVAAPIAQGGQGAIHRFDPNAHPNLRLRVAKLYLDPQKAAADEGRIKHLCANAPDTSRLSNPDCLVWPEEPLFDAAGKFIGYIMPLVKGGKDLEIMCDVVGPRDPAFLHFGGSGVKERNARCQVAANILDALVALESAGDFVLTDLKPPNIQVAPTGLAYLIDLDSVQVASKGQVLFNGMGYTDEYPPPEFYQTPAMLKGYVPKSFERFSMAVILYRLLLNIHPFMGSSPAKDLMDAIRLGYFANGRHRRKFQVLPPPHDDFKSLPAEFQKLFIQAFDAGTDDPARRPSAAEWAGAFARAGFQPGTVTPHQRQNIRKARRAVQPPPTLPPAAQPLPGLGPTNPFGHIPPMPLPMPVLAGNAGIWNSASQSSPYLLPEVVADPQPSNSFDVADPDILLFVRVKTFDLWLQSPQGLVVAGQRVVLEHHYLGPDALWCNFQGNFLGARWVRKILQLVNPLPRFGVTVRDIFGTFEFAFMAKRVHPQGNLERWLRKRMRIEIVVPRHPIVSAKAIVSAIPRGCALGIDYKAVRSLGIPTNLGIPESMTRPAIRGGSAVRPLTRPVALGHSIPVKVKVIKVNSNNVKSFTRNRKSLGQEP